MFIAPANQIIAEVRVPTPDELIAQKGSVARHSAVRNRKVDTDRRDLKM